MANKKPLKLSETHACAQQFESGDTIAAAFIENGVPAGGTAGQVLAKIDGTNYNTEWVDQTGGGGGASYLVYAGMMSASGGSITIDAVLENTTGAAFTWADIGGGVFEITSDVSGLFGDKKTLVFFTPGNSAGSGHSSFYQTTTETFQMINFSADGSGSLSDFTKASFEFRIYP